jgi:predicted O-methyltransferase YrrM
MRSKDKEIEEKMKRNEYGIWYPVRRPRRMNEFVFMMQELVKLFKPHTYVELGLRRGYTFNHITACNVVKRVVGVDLSETMFRGVKRRAGVEFFHMSTDEFSAQWKDPIDMLFIDADHSEESVTKDFDNLAPYVPPCGIILMHDTYPVLPGLETGACKFARSVFKDEKYKDYEIMTFPGTWSGLSVVRKAVKHVHWMED